MSKSDHTTIFCEGCEEPTASRDEHTGFGACWISIGCPCGFVRVLRDDANPERVGVLFHTRLSAFPPANGLEDL